MSTNKKPLATTVVFRIEPGFGVISQGGHRALPRSIVPMTDYYGTKGYRLSEGTYVAVVKKPEEWHSHIYVPNGLFMRSGVLVYVSPSVYEHEESIEVLLVVTEPGVFIAKDTPIIYAVKSDEQEN